MKLEFPVWHEGQKRLLGEVLVRVPTDTRWRVVWFDGVVPDRSWHPPFDRHIDLGITDTALREFARTLEDLNEIGLVGLHQGQRFSLDCHDSTFWRLECNGRLAGLVASWFAGFALQKESP